MEITLKEIAILEDCLRKSKLLEEKEKEDKEEE